MDSRTIVHLLSDWQGAGYIPDYPSHCSLVHPAVHSERCQVALCCRGKGSAVTLEIWKESQRSK